MEYVIEPLHGRVYYADKLNELAARVRQSPCRCEICGAAFAEAAREIRMLIERAS